MSRLWLPTRVLSPGSVARLAVAYSRMTLLLPTVRNEGWPVYLRSCGGEPRTAPWCTWLSVPSVVQPVTRACASIRVRSPITTCGPITAPGPTTTPSPRRAPGSTNAAGWTEALIAGSSPRAASRLGRAIGSLPLVDDRREELGLRDQAAV